MLAPPLHEYATVKMIYGLVFVTRNSGSCSPAADAIVNQYENHRDFFNVFFGHLTAYAGVVLYVF